MPIALITRYTCAVTYQVNDMTGTSPPPNWFLLNGDFYHPLAQVIMAQRVISAIQGGGAIPTPDQVISPSTAAELTAVGLPVPQGVS